MAPKDGRRATATARRDLHQMSEDIGCKKGRMFLAELRLPEYTSRFAIRGLGSSKPRRKIALHRRATVGDASKRT